MSLFVLFLMLLLQTSFGWMRQPAAMPRPRVDCVALSAATSSDPPLNIKSSGLSIGAGVAGIFILLANRLTQDMEKVTDVHSRADIISVVACSALLLNVLSEQDIVARDREPVALMGFALKVPLLDEQSLPSIAQREGTRWFIQSVLDATPATSVHVLIAGSVVGRGGVLGQGDSRGPGLDLPSMSILRKALTQGEEVYLPDLQILPGKVEFTYLPINAQSVLILPLEAGSAVVVATNQAKALKVGDLGRIRALTAIFRKLMNNA